MYTNNLRIDNCQLNHNKTTITIGGCSLSELVAYLITMQVENINPNIETRFLYEEINETIKNSITDCENSAKQLLSLYP